MFLYFLSFLYLVLEMLVGVRNPPRAFPAASTAFVFGAR